MRYAAALIACWLLAPALAGCGLFDGTPTSERDIMKLARRVNDDSAKQRPTVVFMSDFGNTEAVAICHQMMQRVAPGIEIIDFNHTINPFNAEHASILLGRSRDFVDGTVFMAVIDPGVGTQRQPIILKTKKRVLYFVGPNNGIFTDVANLYGVDSVHEIIPRMVNPQWSGWTFDGRDLYSPAAAMVALSKGAAIVHIAKKMNGSNMKRIDTENRVRVSNGSIRAKIVAIDEPYGNLWTQVRPADLRRIGAKEGSLLDISIVKSRRTLRIRWVHTFAKVPAGEDLAYLDSRGGIGSGYFSLGVNTGDFRQKHHVGMGDFIIIAKGEDDENGE